MGHAVYSIGSVLVKKTKVTHITLQFFETRCIFNMLGIIESNEDNTHPKHDLEILIVFSRVTRKTTLINLKQYFFPCNTIKIYHVQ